MGQIGYRTPPLSTRFQKGRSGNPKGRPPNRHREPSWDDLLGQIVTIKEGGVERRVTVAEQFLLFMVKNGLESDSTAARAMLAAVEAAPATTHNQRYDALVRLLVSPGSVNTALEALDIATKVDRYRPTARMQLRPWFMEEALAQLNRPLSLEEQRLVIEAVSMPHEMRWPEWWEIKPWL
jgi:hypothetical protein